MADETSVIYQIGIHATAGTALPTVPAKGSHMDLSGAGFTVIGSRDRGDDANLDESSVTNPFVREDATVQAALSQAPSDHVVRRAGAGEFEFVAYDVSETLYALDSDISVSGHAGTFGTTRTKRTVVIEIAGKQTLYFPQCVVVVTQQEGGVGEDGASRATVLVKPEGTTSIPGGVQINWFQ